MYKAYYNKDIEKLLLKFPSEVSENFRKAIKDIKQCPFPPHTKIKKLHKPQDGYRYKIHPYRILYTVDKIRRVVYIYDFFHRGRGY